MVLWMARPGISYIDVAKAAVQLKEQGINPTVPEIRNLLKTGSYSTINRHLRDWIENQGNQLEAEKGIPTTLLAAVKGLYEAVRNEATQQIAIIEQEYQQKSAGIQSQLQEANISLQRSNKESSNLKEINDQLRNEIESLKESLSLSDKKISDFVTDNDILQQRLNDKNGELTRISLQIENAQKNLEHYREETYKQRQNDKHFFETKINKLESELEKQRLQSQAQLNQINIQANELEKSNAEIINYQNQNDEIEKISINYQEKNIQLTNELQEIKINQQQQEKLHSLLNNENEDLKNDLKKLTIQSAKFEERCQSSLQRIDYLENQIESLRSKCQFLTQDKIELQRKVELLEHVHPA
jgi:chromosome segregation ATPase